ncbi:hypothetical protein [Streptomyces sp. NBC_01304]|uniref:hypothetical protein n=1 Tax=Streptomyces sp. NBC_01304 TaxID=2903818 RepID=UPI002E15ED2A|nr:hypothetical protein OG430_47035 [Streptomyces sp. NBC_01304]
MPDLDRTTASARSTDHAEPPTGTGAAGRAPRPARRRGVDLRHLANDRSKSGRREPRISRNIPRRRGY